MKVDPKSSVGGPAGSPGARPAAGGFRLLIPDGGPAPKTTAAPVAGAAGVSGVGALLALQGLVSPEARALALRKGRRILDALDKLQVALLGQGPTAGNLAQLKGALAEQRQASGDPALDEVLHWAEVRAAVEAAKLERSPEAA
jgi:hypothetical protein